MGKSTKEAWTKGKNLSPEALEKRKKINKKIMKFGCLPALAFLVIVIFISVLLDKTEETNKVNKEIEKTVKIVKVKLTDEQYISKYNAEFDSIKLIKLFGVAPLYGKYADELNEILNDIKEEDSLFNIFSNPKIKAVYNSNYKKWGNSIDNYLKYGEPDVDLIFINSAAELSLKSYLNDPDFEVVKYNYYLKQTNTGYDYQGQRI